MATGELFAKFYCGGERTKLLSFLVRGSPSFKLLYFKFVGIGSVTPVGIPSLPSGKRRGDAALGLSDERRVSATCLDTSCRHVTS